MGNFGNRNSIVFGSRHHWAIYIGSVCRFSLNRSMHLTDSTAWAFQLHTEFLAVPHQTAEQKSRCNILQPVPVSQKTLEPGVRKNGLSSNAWYSSSHFLTTFPIIYNICSLSVTPSTFASSICLISKSLNYRHSWLSLLGKFLSLNVQTGLDSSKGLVGKILNCPFKVLP